MSATSSTRLSPSPNLLQVNEPKRYGSTLSLEEKCEQSFFLFYYYRMEDEAVLDRGASLLKHKCDEEEVEGHHTIYIGVRVPKSYRRRRRHRRRAGHKDRKEKLTENASDKSDTENNDEASNSILKPLTEEGKPVLKPLPNGHHCQPMNRSIFPLSAVSPAAERIRFILGEEDDGPAPPQLFTELDELLSVDGQEMEWKETARWIKFEEKVEKGGERWSKPHVATLSLHSLFELRTCIEKGTIMLDMEASTLPQVVELIIDNQIEIGQLKADLKDKWVCLSTLFSAFPLLPWTGYDNLLLLLMLMLMMMLMMLMMLLKARSPLENSLTCLSGRISMEDLGSQRSTSMDWLNSPTTTHRNLTSSSMNDISDKPEKDQGGSASANPLAWCSFIYGRAEENQSEQTEAAETTPSKVHCSRRWRHHAACCSCSRPAASQLRNKFMKKLPRDAEASNVLVGEVDFLDAPFVAFVRLQQAVMLGALTEVPVPTRFLFILLGPKGKAKSYHEIGRAIATLMSDEVFHDIAYKAKDRQDLLAGIDEFLDEVIVLPPGEWDPTIRIEPPKSLPSSDKRKNMYAGGDAQMNGDMPHDGGHGGGGHAALSAILFIYLGTVTNAITFGGLLGDATENMQGVLESFLGTAITGGVFCLLAGQPLTILSSTGPVLVFERLLFNFSKDNEFDYLEFRLWIGLWSAFFCLVLVATDAKNSTDIVGDPLEGTSVWFWNNTDLPMNATWSSLTKTECLKYKGELVGKACEFVPDITLMSFILFFGTYTCSMCLKKFKTSPFFPTTLISDFAIILAILIFCGVDMLVGVDTPKLIVPSEFKPTSPDRGWFVPPFGGNPWWVYLASALPALLVTILVFMDQQITAVIVNRKEHKLKKGAGYHLDLFWVAVLLVVCSFMGLPWYVAATVISIAHIDSLKMETETSAPGEQPKFLGVREQRVTGVCVFILTGLSVFMSPILKFIPMPVLYGVFLYMGVASLNGVQFMDRLKLLLMPAKHQPDLVYLRHVPLRKVHLFTFLQVVCLALLWILKSTVAAIIFPVMILALVAVRKAMDYMFSQHDLSFLDDVIPEKDKKKKEDDKKKKRGSIDSDAEDESPLHSLTGTHRAEQLRYYKANCLSSPELSPLKPVPQIRIDMDPDDEDTFYWRGRGSETSL
ncbi:hypothetical protein INR49_003311 [Caranx melampygus]|nr:hypothetical protein INR49_003311 [Caranx melampygus]